MNGASLEGLNRGLLAGAAIRLGSTFETVARGVRSHALLYTIVLLTFTLAMIENQWLGLTMNFELVGLVSSTTFVFLFLLIGIWLAVELARLWFTGYRGSPVLALKRKLLDDILAPERVSNTIHAFVINGLFFVAFLAIKKGIPLLQPFAWDESLMNIDRALHFGYLPHEILGAFLQFPFATFAINLAYNFWFVVLIACFFWQGFAGTDNPLRQRFLVSYFLTWLVGTCVLGTIFSSAGPCFYGFVVHGENPYAVLMAYLHEANGVYPIWAVPTQDMLWQSTLAGHGDIEGVSAMPSMHVGIAVLLAVLGFAAGKRKLGWGLAGFAGLIFVGSILLGWHYAVDGYLGAATALLCWWLAGKLVVATRAPDCAAAQGVLT
jgi:hypothetical protein